MIHPGSHSGAACLQCCGRQQLGRRQRHPQARLRAHGIALVQVQHLIAVQAHQVGFASAAVARPTPDQGVQEVVRIEACHHVAAERRVRIVGPERTDNVHAGRQGVGDHQVAVEGLSSGGHQGQKSQRLGGQPARFTQPADLVAAGIEHHDGGQRVGLQRAAQGCQTLRTQGTCFASGDLFQFLRDRAHVGNAGNDGHHAFAPQFHLLGLERGDGLQVRVGVLLLHRGVESQNAIAEPGNRQDEGQHDGEDALSGTVDCLRIGGIRHGQGRRDRGARRVRHFQHDIEQHTGDGHEGQALVDLQFLQQKRAADQRRQTVVRQHDPQSCKTGIEQCDGAGTQAWGF